MTVPGVEGVEAKNVERLVREIGLQDLRDVAVMAEGHVDIFQAAVRLVDSVLGLIFGNISVRVGLEVFGKDNLIGPGATDWECVADNTPLRFAIEAEAFS